MATLDEVYALLLALMKQVDKIEVHTRETNGHVGTLDSRVAVLEEWKRCMGEPAARTAQDNRVEIAKFLALGVSAGTVLGLIAKFVA